MTHYKLMELLDRYHGHFGDHLDEFDELDTATQVALVQCTLLNVLEALADLDDDEARRLQALLDAAQGRDNECHVYYGVEDYLCWHYDGAPVDTPTLCKLIDDLEDSADPFVIDNQANFEPVDLEEWKKCYRLYLYDVADYLVNRAVSATDWMWDHEWGIHSQPVAFYTLRDCAPLDDTLQAYPLATGNSLIYTTNGTFLFAWDPATKSWYRDSALIPSARVQELFNLAANAYTLPTADVATLPLYQES